MISAGRDRAQRGRVSGDGVLNGVLKGSPILRLLVVGRLLGPLGILVAALILVFGHALNMALGLLSVLVHGLRLNMLEFSGHLGQEWTGQKYAPLQRRLARQ